MVISAIIALLMALTILDVICGNRPVFEGSGCSFLEWSFGAFSIIAICAGGVTGLSLIVSDYWGKHTLKRYQVTPVGPALTLLVQVAIYALYAVVSLLSLYLMTAVSFGYRSRGSSVTSLSSYLLVMISTLSIGVVVGDVALNMKIASIVVSVLYSPMLLLSGATLSYEIMPEVLQKFADTLPLTQGIKLLKTAPLGLPITSVIGPALIVAILAVPRVATSLRLFKWETES